MKREFNDVGYSYSNEKEIRILISSLAIHNNKKETKDWIPVQYSNKDPMKPIDLSSQKDQKEPCHTNLFFDLSSLIEIRCYDEKSRSQIKKILEELKLKINVTYDNFEKYVNE